MPGRPRDDFGIGWARTKFSDDFVPYLRSTFGFGLEREDAMDRYYNAAVTRWLSVSLASSSGASVSAQIRQWVSSNSFTNPTDLRHEAARENPSRV